MAGLSTNAPGLWGGFAGLLYGSTSLSTPPGFLADAVPAWVPAGGVLAFEFDNGRGFNSIDRTKTTPDSILTYTNPSTKMVYGSDGVLTYPSMNLVTYSEQFDNPAWTKSNTTITEADQVVAPNGTTTADLITKTSASYSYVRQAPSTAIGQVHVWSVYAKVGTGTVLVLGSAQTSQYAEFDLVAVTATVTTGSSTTSITSVGNGWFRCSMTISTPTTITGYEISPKTNGETLYIWGAQREQVAARTSPSTYIPTTTAAVYSLPIDHNPTTFEPLGVLIEEQRTNLLTYSQGADNAAWGKGNSTVTANQAVAPDGTITMDKFVEAADVAQQHDLNNLVTLANATTYAMSLYMKAAERTIVRLLASGSAYSGAGTTAERSAFFDLSAGTVSTVGSGLVSASIQSVGNGIYRCTIVDTTTSAAAGGLTATLVSTGTTTTYNGDGTSGVYIWGAQLE